LCPSPPAEPLMLPVNRISLFTTLFVSLASAAHAQSGEPQPDSSPPRRVVLPKTMDVALADPGIPGTTLPVVDVMINGRGPFRFAIETGAGFVALSPTLAETAGLKQDATSGGLPSYLIDSITFGGASFQGVRAEAIPRGGTGVDGLLGLPFFRDVLLTIDYPARRVRISRDTLPAADGQSIIQLSRTGPFWGVPVDFAGQQLVGVLDTRGTGMLSVIPQVASTLSFATPLRVIGRASGAAIPDAEVKAGDLAGDVRIGQYSFTRPTISVRALPPNFPTGPIVGDLVLRNFTMSLDQRHARLRLERSGSAAIELPRPGQPGRAMSPAPAASAATGLSAYVGQYGDRTISLRDGVLYIQRPAGQALEMRSTGRDSFELTQVADAKIEFVRDASGNVESIRVFRAGAWETVKRNP